MRGRVILLKKLLSSCLVVIVVAGCATTTMVMVDETLKFPPTSNVEILQSPPDRPYKVIAILETRGTGDHTLPDLIESMREKAKEIGADAILFQDVSEKTSGGFFMMFNPALGGYQAFGSGGSKRPIIRGMAIKYQ